MQKWGEKQLYGYFKQKHGNITSVKTWKWLRKKNLKKEIECIRTEAEIHGIKTNYINYLPEYWLISRVFANGVAYWPPTRPSCQNI